MIAKSKAKSRSGRSGPLALRSYGVDDGTRTHDTRNHNPMLYQLNYIHHMEDLRKTTRRVSKRDRGCFWYARRDSIPRPTA